MANQEKSNQPEKKTRTQRMLGFGAAIVGLALGAEFVKSMFRHN